MNKLVILITGAGGDIGQSIIKCLEELGQDYEIDMLGCDIDPYSASKNKCTEFFVAPPVVEKRDYFEFIQNIVDTKAPDYIIPTTEQEIEFYDKHRREMGNIRLLINKSDIINTFCDKYETAKFFKMYNMAYPKTCLFEDYKDDLPMPIILKPRRGRGGKGLIIVKDSEELSRLRDQLNGYVVQEVVGSVSEEYTAGVFSDGNRTHTISFRRLLGYGSCTKFAQLVHSDEIDDIAKKVARAANLEGCLNIQFRRTASGYIPFEVNPRFSSTVYIRHCFGFRDVKWWIDYYEGKSINYELKYRKGTAVKTLTDVFFDMETV